MKKRIKCLLMMLMISPALSALTGLEIAQKSDAVAEPEYTHTLVKMDLIERNGKIATRMIEQWGVDNGELNSNVLVFRSPASVKNTRFLQVENEERNDDQWIFLPALRRVRRIASSEGDKSFMGSDATYDDMESREVERDTHTFLKEETSGIWDCYVVKARTIDPDDSQYSHIITWFDKETYVAVQMEMYDKKEELLKVLTVKDLQNISGYWTPVDTLIENVQNGHSTTMTIVNAEFDKPVNHRIFTTQFLSTGR